MEKTKDLGKIENIQINIPTIALRDITVMPDMIIHFDLSRFKSIQAVEQAMISDQKIFLVAQKSPETNEPGMDDIYSIGTIATIRKVSKLSDALIRVLVEGGKRARLLGFAEHITDYLYAQVEVIETENEAYVFDNELLRHEAMKRELQTLCVEYGKVNPKASKTLGGILKAIQPLGKMMDEIAMNIPMDYRKRQEVLEAWEIETRFHVLTGIICNELEILKLRMQLGSQIKGRIEKNQKEYFLREQLHYIRQELGEEGAFSDADQFEKDLKKLKAGKEVKERITKEIKRFKSLNSTSSESSV